MNRRDLLCRGFIFAAASAVLPLELAAQTDRFSKRTLKPPTTPRPSGTQMSMHIFEQLKNSHFLVVQNGDSLDQYLILAEVIEMPAPSKGRKCAGFTLRFLGGSPYRLPQGVYTLSNPKLGKAVKMLLVPGRDSLAPEYYAAFNHLI